MGVNYEELYTSLGFLLYSIAASDGTVRTEERTALKALIAKQWLPLEDSRDDLGTDEGRYVDISFDYASDEAMPPAEAFERFADHVRREPATFDEGLRRMIFQSAMDIATAAAGRNKAELTRLMALEELFKQYPVTHRA